MKLTVGELENGSGVSTKTNLRLAVIVSSVGRPACLRELIPHLQYQTRPADRVLFVVTDEKDVGCDPLPPIGNDTQIEVVFSGKGLCKQRNAGLDLIQDDVDLVVFYDDDFVPSRHALEGIVAGFEKWPDVGGMTGHVIADGIGGPGFSDAAATSMVADYDATFTQSTKILEHELAGLYGCNMAFRLEAVGTARFDEAVPLYGWQEDIDFSARVRGKLVKTDAFAGVHRGAKTGREISGRRLGYSQIANPWYFWRKGSMTARFAARLAFRNLMANHAKILRPEPWIDRRGRAAGNWIAFWDIIVGKAHPGRILEIRTP